jgi:hypothetical protein
MEDHRAADFSLVVADWAGAPFMHHGQMPGSRGSGMASPEFCHVAVPIRPKSVSLKLDVVSEVAEELYGNGDNMLTSDCDCIDY